ncbi:MAG: methyltransferase domain-containing protein, partial [Candidatus Magasanikbacteria bacterium]|nr:methyltransferase domain-containing protein [Candidatus Magasanikbacteria bacterium]
MKIKPFIKVPLVILENMFFSIFPNSRPIIERLVYNPYQFNAEHIAYSKNQFNKFVKKIGGISEIDNKNILELGPGGSLGFGLLAIKNGAARYFAIENGQHSFVNKKQIGFYRELLGNDHDFLNKIFIFKNDRYYYNQNLVTFIEIDQQSNYSIDSNLIDIIYSCAVLEHVHNLNLCFSEMTRVLKVGGSMNHQVDLRDHIFAQN